MTEKTTLPRQADHVEELAQEIVDARQAQLKSRIRPQSDQPYLYLSGIHSCLRNNYYQLTVGARRKPVDEFLQAKFDAGNLWERETVRELLDMGFSVIESQASVEIKKGGRVIARGKIDGKLNYKGTKYPIEIKSLDPNAWKRIESVDDLFKSEWTEKYIRQILMYLYGHDLEAGFFLINDRAGHWKILPIYLGNYLEVAERTLQLIEQSWAAKEKWEANERSEAAIESCAPPRIAFNHRICGKCPFNTVCMPTQVIEGGVVLDDPEIEFMLERHEILKPMSKEFDEVHESLKELFAEKPATTIGGRFIVTPRMQTRKTKDYKLLNLTKEQIAEITKETTSWSFTVDDVTKGAEDKSE